MTTVKLIERLWDQYSIKPVIDIRNMWKDEDKTRLATGKNNVVYDYCGPVLGVRWLMAALSRIGTPSKPLINPTINQ